MSFRSNTVVCGCLQGIMSNGPAQRYDVPQALQTLGGLSGDPFEISTIRREVVHQSFCQCHLIFVCQLVNCSTCSMEPGSGKHGRK